MNKFLRFLTDKAFRFNILNARGVYKNLSDEAFLKRKFKLVFGKELDLDSPQTYSEKLQWLKLYDRKPEYTQMVDKYEAKRYVAERIGEEYIIPTLGVWDSFDEIDFDSLPDQFVLKCTHDSGGLVVCTDKSKLDVAAAKTKIESCLKRNYYVHSRDWPYKDVKPRIIAESYMEDAETGELRDYKFFCFGGKARLLFIATERQSADSETKFDFFDMEFNHLPFRNGHPNAEKLPAKPEHFEKMWELAEKLSAGIPQLRVEFYEANGKVYFVELTFFHWSGMKPFEPEEWDLTLGKWIELPEAIKQN